jgi:hypothetical protein
VQTQHDLRQLIMKFVSKISGGLVTRPDQQVSDAARRKAAVVAQTNIVCHQHEVLELIRQQLLSAGMRKVCVCVCVCVYVCVRD